MDRWIFEQNTVDVQMTDKVQVGICHKGSTLRRVRGREGPDFDWRLGQTDHATLQEDFPKVSASCGLLLLVVSVALAAVPPELWPAGLRSCRFCRYFAMSLEQTGGVAAGDLILAVALTSPVPVKLLQTRYTCWSADINDILLPCSGFSSFSVVSPGVDAWGLTMKSTWPNLAELIDCLGGCKGKPAVLSYICCFFCSSCTWF